MKKIISSLAPAALALSCALLSAPAHAQWVANDPVPVPSHSTDNVPVTGTSTAYALGSQTPGPGTFKCHVEYGISTTYNGQSVDTEEANQWKQTYTWTGTGTPPPFQVSVSGQLSGQATISGSGYTSASADAQCTKNVPNPDGTVTTTAVFPEIGQGTPGTGGGTLDKNGSGTAYLSSSAEYLLVTLDAKTGGANWDGGSSNGNATAQVTLGPPQ